MRYYALIIAALLTGCTAEEQPKKEETAKAVKTITLSEATNKNILTFPGNVLAGKQADITFKVSGKLSALPVKEGQLIKKGDVIARLDQKDFKLDYSKQLAAYKQQEASLARAEELIKDRYISQSDFDKKKEAYEVAKANLGIAKTNLNYTVLKAPFSGEIARVYVDNYQNVQVKEQIVTLQNLDFLEIKVNIPEKILINTQTVEQINVSVRFDANDKNSYPATVTEIAKKADPSTQTYQATIRLPSPKDLNVLPGMTAIVSITATIDKEMYNSFKIPANAMFAQTSKETFVWVVNSENRLVKTPVTAKSFEGDDVNITEGLKPGDRVVIAGVNFLREHQLVTDYK